MSTLENVKLNKHFGYFFCPCVLTIDLIDEIQSLDANMKFYDYECIQRHETGVKYLDELAEADLEDASESYKMAGLSEDESDPDSMDAIYTRLDPIQLFEAVKQFFGSTIDPAYKAILIEREKIEDALEQKLRMYKESREESFATELQMRKAS